MGTFGGGLCSAAIGRPMTGNGNNDDDGYQSVDIISIRYKTSFKR